ncbi:MAG: threonine ammonia-lyase [Burkholderiales bacterium]|nr:threonine ammonia-lyase [Burkholderiales bacterium]
MVTLDHVRRAAETIRGQVHDTPCDESRTLSEICGARIFLKFENLQFTASFKERGALAKLLSLDAAGRARGVIAVSAGNHAQGVAYHAKRLGIPAVIVMPRFTPAVKVERTAFHGPEVVLHGADFDAAREHGLALAAERGLTLVHPYDDPLVIAGQGTVGLEMLARVPDLEVLVVPVGGGGLVSGIAVAAHGLQPSIEVVGAQAQRYPTMYNALKGTALPCGPSTIADGIAVKAPGILTRAIAREHVADVLLADEAGLEEAVLLLLEVEKTVVEGAGAAALAVLLCNRERFAGRTVGLVLSGGNIDPLVLTEIIERGLVRTHRLARIRIGVRDVPGSLAAVTAIIAEANANIIEVHHQRAFTRLPAQNADIELVLQTRGPRHLRDVLAALDAGGYPAQALEA